MKNVLTQYSKHTALNLGQLTRDFVYFIDHPAAEKSAPEGTLTYKFHSARLRILSMGNNFFYSIVPPHTHHTRQQLDDLCIGSHRQWFLHGFKPWLYPQP